MICLYLPTLTESKDEDRSFIDDTKNNISSNKIMTVWNTSIVEENFFDDSELCNNTFYVYKDDEDNCNHFIPSGWMPEEEAGKTITFKSNWTSDPYSGNSCIKIEVNGATWAGIYWQEPEGNWGDKKDAGYDLRGATKITFMAKGDIGGENIAFFMGGIGVDDKDKSYPDSLEKTPLSDVISLTDTWTEYTIDLTSKDKDKSHVIGGFAWVLDSSTNSNNVTFYLDEIKYEITRGKIYGYVTNTSDEYIKSVKLTLEGKTRKIKQRTKSGNKGFFEFTALEEDTYVITAKKKGYKKSIQEVVLGNEEEKENTIELEKNNTSE